MATAKKNHNNVCDDKHNDNDAQKLMQIYMVLHIRIFPPFDSKRARRVLPNPPAYNFPPLFLI